MTPKWTYTSFPTSQTRPMFIISRESRKDLVATSQDAALQKRWIVGSTSFKSVESQEQLSLILR